MGRRSVLSRWLLTGAVCAAAPAPLAAQVGVAGWTGFDRTGFRLVEVGGEYRLERASGPPLAVPREWLIPPGEAEADAESYVTAFAYSEEVTAFPIGDGLLGLHLSSYAIQSEGSANAADGSDVLLILDPFEDRLRPGLVLVGSKGRVRVGGCASAWFQRLQVGDLDCDRRLDVAASIERIDCGLGDDDDPGGPVLVQEPLHWYLQGSDGWTRREADDGRLPCAGLLELPLGLAKSPVDFVLETVGDRPPLPWRALTLEEPGLTLSIPAEWRVERSGEESPVRIRGPGFSLRVGWAEPEPPGERAERIEALVGAEASRPGAGHREVGRGDFEVPGSGAGLGGQWVALGTSADAVAGLVVSVETREQRAAWLVLSFERDATRAGWEAYRQLVLRSLRNAR